MVDAQQWLKENYENKKNSEAVKEIKVKEGTELKGELEIKDYPDLEAIFLPFTKEITTLTIGSCPKIEVIFVPGNKITKIEGLKDLTQLRELNFGENQVEEIDVSNNNILEDLSLHKNPKTFKFTGGFGSLKNLLKLVTWNSEDTLPIANILEGLSENDLKEVADKLGVKTENKPKEDIKKEIIAEIEKNNQNKEKLKDPKTGIPDLLNENGEIDKDKLEKLKDDAKKYEALVAEPKNDPVKSADKKDIEQAELTKLIEAVEKIKNVLGVSPNDSLPNGWENKLDDLKNRPTQDDLNNAVKNAEDKYKDYINPNSPGDKNKLEQATKDAGFINPADSSALEKAANGQGKAVINQTDLNNLKNNQEKHKPEDLEKHKPGDLKPVDLPANWKTELARIPGLVANQKPSDYDAIKNELERWKKLGQNPEKVAQDIKDLQSRPATGGTALNSVEQYDYLVVRAYLRKNEGNNWRKNIDAWKSKSINVSYIENSKQFLAQIEQKPK